MESRGGYIMLLKLKEINKLRYLKRQVNSLFLKRIITAVSIGFR